MSSGFPNDPFNQPPHNSANPYAANQMPPAYGQYPQGGFPEQQGDGTGGLIPYKNPKALTAYYLGIFGLFPCIGLPLSVAAVILGVLGLKARAANPIIKGSVHAWIGIVLGSIATLYSTLFLVGFIIAMIGESARR